MEPTCLRTTKRKFQTVVPQRAGYVLLNPGPVNTSARVKAALLAHDICHREPEFGDVMRRVTSKLRKIYRGGSEHSVVLVSGSGTAAMECAISSCVPQDKKILVIDNGAFGERLAEIATLHEMGLVHLRYEYGDEVRVEDIERALAEHPDIAVVAMCHHETSVGLLNPVREVGSLCRESGCLFLVDAVSSLGAEDLDVVRDQIDVCWSSANKCLHSVPGVSFLCVSPRVWPRIALIKPRVYYLDLKRYRKYIDEKAQTPFTPAVTAIFALEAACDEHLEDGAQARQALYAARNERLRAGLTRLGLVPYTATSQESHSIVTASLPLGVKFPELYGAMKSRGFVIYDCKPPLQGKYLQIANMGEVSHEILALFLATLEECLASLRLLSARAS